MSEGLSLPGLGWLWHRQGLQGCCPLLHLGEEGVGGPPLIKEPTQPRELLCRPTVNFSTASRGNCSWEGQCFHLYTPCHYLRVFLSQMLSSLQPAPKC